MEDGVSFTPNSLAFDIPISTDRYEQEEAEAADALKREKQIEEDLQNAFDDLSNDDDDDDDDSHSSDEDSINSSHQKSKSYAEHSSVKTSFEFEEQTLPPNETSNLLSSISHQSDYPEEHPRDSVSEHSRHSDENHSDIFNDHRTKGNHWNNGNISELNSDIVSNGQHCEFPGITSKDSAQYNEVKRSFESVSNLSDKNQTKSVLNSSVSAEYNRPSDLEEEYMKLQILFKTRGKELEQIKREEIKAREKYDHEIKSLKLRLTLIEGEKERLTSALQESQKLISEYRHENSVLKGKLAAVELQFSAEKEAKENAFSKIQSAEITIQSLEQQISGLARSENALRLRDQTESIAKDLKMRHQKEVLQLKEEIDKLQGNLNSKINESESMLLKMSHLQRKCEDLQVEKSEIFNKLSANLEASQRQCQKLLESGTISELSILKLQIQHLQEEKSKLDKQNSALKDEVKSLEGELQACEALKKLENHNEESIKAHGDKKRHSSQKDSSLKTELQKSLKNVQSLRSQNSSLKEKLEELKQKLPMWEERAKLFESRYKESEAKARDFEKKLGEVLPSGSVPGFEHEKKVNALQNELIDLKTKLHNVTERLKSSSANEEKLYEDNKNLKTNISEMLKSHASEKINAVELCREKYLEIHESAINKLKEELTSKADKELKVVCLNYENKISQLQKELKYLNEGLYDAKTQYIKVFEENKSLQSKIDSMSKPKEREEIEREIKNEYEQKLREMKQVQEHNKNHYESLLESEIERVQKMWTKQKMVEIQEFVNSTKQQLDEEFVKCLEKERSNCQSEIKAEREKFHEECQQKINDIKQRCETEKDNLKAQLRESFQLKWKNEIKELQQSHQKEIESIREKFETKISTMENEMRTLKGNLCQKSEESEHMQNLKQEFSNQRQAWEREKMDFINNEHTIDKKLTSALEVEEKLLGKVKKYHKYISSQKKHYQGKIKELESETEKLKTSIVDKEKQLLTMKEHYEQNILEMELNLKKYANIRNSECQTEEKLVSQKTLIKVQDMFIQCLKKISDDIKTYLLNSRKRSAEQLKKALSFYHDHLISKIYQDVLKDACSVTSNIYIPHTHGNFQSRSSSRDHLPSPNTMQHQFNSNLKISNSSPIDNLSAGDMHRKLESCAGDLNGVKMFQNAMSTPESGIRFGDMSFDYVPLRMPDTAFTSTKMPEHYVPSGLFNHQNIFPERDSPVSVIK